MKEQTNREESGIDKLVAEKAPELVDYLDIPYELEVVVGRTVLTVEQLLHLREGDTLKLDRAASEMLILLLENLPLAQVEIIRIKGGTGARIADYTL